jgi:DNA polymerase-3 subunit gamma/tau
MPGLGVHCPAIMESRHVDVMEMDAASHTGVENIRQITDAVRYAPVQARYKVYIVDEVHMLSTAAFNAFLKTLEEPPPHAKFIFATTEIRKVPVTVLSRCQRFDLRRVETPVLVRHLERICAAEGIAAEPEALAILARASEGSVRDSLSLLDQAVAHGGGTVGAAAVQDMLGLADRGQVIDLFEAVMRGGVAESFAILRAGWEGGADPSQTLADLASFVHLVTRVKHVPEAARDPALTEAERVRSADFAGRLGIGALSRAWQILLKAVPEVAASSQPLAAAEMALVRLAYAATLPPPEEALRRLREGVSAATGLAPAPGPAPAPDRPVDASPTPRIPPAPPAPQIAPSPEPPRVAARGGTSARRAEAAPAVDHPDRAAPGHPEPIRLRRFEDVVALARERREIGLTTALEQHVRLVRFEEGRIEMSLGEGASRTLSNDLARALDAWTGRRWIVALSSEPGGPTLAEQRRARENERRSDAASHPLVQAVLSSFPGAAIVDVRERAAAEPDPGPDLLPIAAEGGPDPVEDA